jgi:Barrel-sandwich domain of CusB or HlyD membrane-fusion
MEEGVQEFRSSGVQEFRSSGVQGRTSHKITIKKPCHLNFRLPLSWLVAPELLQLLELLNSFPIAFRPENGPFIVKSCHTEVDDVIDVTGFSRARLAKTVLMSPVKYENQRSRTEVCDLAVRVGGVVGIRQVDEGNYVQTNDTNGIVVLTQMQPMSVIFTVPEDKILHVTKRIHEGATLAVTAYDRTDTTQISTGTLATTDNQVDTSTGTVKLRALFPNDKEELFPQQFVNARLLVDTLKDAVIVPTPAIQLGAPGSYVYVVNSDSTVSVRVVKAGPTDGQRTAILSGLELGETVATDGVDRLYDGAKVQLPTDKTPANDTPGRPHRPFAGPSGSPREHHRRLWNDNGQQKRPTDAN